MAILSTIKKVLPYIKTATGYVLCRLSSQAVEMDDGTTLQESYDSLNGKTKYYFSGIAWTDPVYSINKKAGIVYIDYYCVVSGGVGGRAFPIATLPEGVRPPNRIRSQAWCAGGNSMRHGASIDISTDGVIQFIAGGDFVEAGFTLSYLL